jgi:hypothetical protein
VQYSAIAYQLWHLDNWQRNGERRRKSLELESETRASRRIRCEDGLVDERS